MSQTQAKTQAKTQATEQSITQPLTKNQIIYLARILPPSFNLYELKIRTVADTYFVGTDKRTKHAFLFSYSDLGKSVFLNRSDALELVKKAEARYKEEHKDDVVNDEEE